MSINPAKRCPRCQKQVPVRDVFCTQCGLKFPALPPPVSALPPQAPSQPAVKPEAAAGGVAGGAALIAFLVWSHFGAGGGLPNDYRIQVLASPGLTFSGSYGGLRADGTSWSQSVTGENGSVFTVKNSTFVTVVFQKQGQSGTLGVAVYRGDTLVEAESTEAPYGIVQIGQR